MSLQDCWLKQLCFLRYCICTICTRGVYVCICVSPRSTGQRIVSCMEVWRMYCVFGSYLLSWEDFCTCVMFHHPVQLDTSDLYVSVPCWVTAYTIVFDFPDVSSYVISWIIGTPTSASKIVRGENIAHCKGHTNSMTYMLPKALMKVHPAWQSSPELDEADCTWMWAKLRRYCIVWAILCIIRNGQDRQQSSRVKCLHAHCCCARLLDNEHTHTT